MKVSRIIALSLLVLLGGTTVVAVYLHAQEAIVPRSKPPVSKPDLDAYQPGPNTRVPVVIGNDHQDWGNRTQYQRTPLDRETLQLINQEQAADQEAKSLAAQYAQAGTEEKSAEVKKKLREKLAAIFAMQQKRRTAEITSIEERLARLKDISKKRETNKDAIVDRRLEQLTGGVDELGWEESNRGAIRFSVPALGPNYYVEPNANGGNSLDYGNPVLVPRSDNVPAAEPDPVSPVPALRLPSE